MFSYSHSTEPSPNPFPVSAPINIGKHEPPPIPSWFNRRPPRQDNTIVPPLDLDPGTPDSSPDYPSPITCRVNFDGIPVEKCSDFYEKPRVKAWHVELPSYDFPPQVETMVSVTVHQKERFSAGPSTSSRTEPEKVGSLVTKEKFDSNVADKKFCSSFPYRKLSSIPEEGDSSEPEKKRSSPVSKEKIGSTNTDRESCSLDSKEKKFDYAVSEKTFSSAVLYKKLRTIPEEVGSTEPKMKCFSAVSMERDGIADTDMKLGSTVFKEKKFNSKEQKFDYAVPENEFCSTVPDEKLCTGLEEVGSTEPEKKLCSPVSKERVDSIDTDQKFFSLDTKEKKFDDAVFYKKLCTVAGEADSTEPEKKFGSIAPKENVGSTAADKKFCSVVLKRKKYDCVVPEKKFQSTSPHKKLCTIPEDFDSLETKKKFSSPVLKEKKFGCTVPIKKFCRTFLHKKLCIIPEEIDRMEPERKFCNSVPKEEIDSTDLDQEFFPKEKVSRAVLVIKICGTVPHKTLFTIPKEVDSSDSEKVGSGASKNIGSSASENIGNNDSEEVGSSASENIGSSASENIGSSASENIGNNDYENIGSSASENIGNNDSENIGSSASENIGNNDYENIGSSASENIGNNDSENIGSTDSENIGNNDSENIGSSASENIGNNDSENIGSTDSENIGNNDYENIGSTDSENVGSNATEDINSSESEKINSSDSAEVGSSDSEKVGSSDSEEIGSSELEMIGKRESEKVGSSNSEEVGSSDSVKVGSSDSVKVGSSDWEIIGNSDWEIIGSSDSEAVGSGDSENVGSIDFVESFEDDRDGTYVGSFPKGFGYGPEETEIEGAGNSGEEKPRILLMGLRRSGKSSIQKVVFHKVSPNETLFLESTNKIVKDDISNSSFVQFQIWDIPGQIDFFDATFDSEYIFGGCGALIFVIDAQDDYMEALSRLQMAVTRAHKINENIKFEVFIHKVDGLSDDNKIETQRDILQRATDELADAGGDNIRLSFHLTSIYDHSIFEAFSKVVQKLIPQLPVLENLLDIVISHSKIEKAFLFDVVSKIYIATDSSPVDMQCYELCCDMIDVVIDMSGIYGARDDGAFDNESASFIKLNSSTVLFLREVNRHLALLCILREDGCENRGIIEYNFKCFRNAIQEVFVARNKQEARSTGHPQMDRLVNGQSGDALANGLNGQNGLVSQTSPGHSHLNGSVVQEAGD